MVHFDWAAWDAWMEANDHLVKQGVVPSCERITRKVDFGGSVETQDRERNLAETIKFNRNLATLEESRIHAEMNA